MRNPSLPLRGLWVLTCLLTSLPFSGARAEPADCSAMENVARNESYEADDRAIYECILRGWDPPVKWRPKEGKSAGIRVGGAGGFSVNARQDPKQPPGVTSSKSSISADLFNFTLKFPPWRGFPCQLPGGIDVCGDEFTTPPEAPPTTGSTAACAVNADTSGMFGNKQPIQAGSVDVPCGASVPLSTYLMGLSPNAVGMIATEAGSRTTYVYRKSGDQYVQVNSRALPDKVCQGSTSFSINPPIGQMITFPANGTIALRLQKSEENLNQLSDPFAPDPNVEKDMFLLLQISGGVPTIPNSCLPRSAHYFEKPPITTPIVVESATNPGCDGDPADCGNLPATPTAPPSCDIVTLRPAGPSCQGSTQFASLDRPSLVYPSASTANFASIQNRTAMIAESSDNARLYAQAETIIYLGSSSGPLVLPEGGTLLLANGDRLEMHGPATVNASTGQVTLPNGGSVITPGGTLTTAINPGQTVSPNAVVPFTLKLGRSVELPNGYAVPTRPTPFIQLPVATP